MAKSTGLLGDIQVQKECPNKKDKDASDSFAFRSPVSPNSTTGDRALFIPCLSLQFHSAINAETGAIDNASTNHALFDHTATLPPFLDKEPFPPKS